MVMCEDGCRHSASARSGQLHKPPRLQIDRNLLPPVCRDDELLGTAELERSSFRPPSTIAGSLHMFPNLLIA